MTRVTLAPLGEIASLQAGVGFPLDLQGRSSGDYPVAKVGDISRVGRSGDVVLRTADHFVSEEDLKRLRAKPIPVGSILFAKIGEAIRQNHRVIAGCPLLVDNNAMAAIPTARVESRYLYHFLRTVDFYGLASTTTVPALRKSDLARLQVPLPSLPEQRRIADVLDMAEALRAKRRATLARFDPLIEAMFLAMFGDPKRSPRRWPAREFDQTMRDETSRSEKLQQSEFLAHGRFPVVDQGQAEIAGYCDDPRYLCRSELPVVVFGDHTRVVKLVRNPFVVGADGAKVLAPQRGVDAEFLYWLLRLSPIPDLGYSRHMREVKRLTFPVPPLDSQLAFGRNAAMVEKLRPSYRASLVELNALFASLQHRAFRGEL